MSGFAHVTGQPDGPPTLPPFFLADGVASQSAAAAVMMALYHRDVHGGGGQLIDVNLIEPLARLIETSTLTYSHLGTVPGRVGNLLAGQRAAQRLPDVRTAGGSPSRARRPTSRCACSGPSTGPSSSTIPTYADPIRRQAPRRRARRASSPTGSESRTLDEVDGRVRTAEVAAAPVYDAQQLLADEHLRARGSFVDVDDPDLGSMTVQAPVARLSDTPGRVEHLGRDLGADNDAVYGGLLGLERRAARRVACGRDDLRARRYSARTPGPSLRAGHPGQQRAYVREGADRRR